MRRSGRNGSPPHRPRSLALLGTGDLAHTDRLDSDLTQTVWTNHDHLDYTGAAYHVTSAPASGEIGAAADEDPDRGRTVTRPPRRRPGTLTVTP